MRSRLPVVLVAFLYLPSGAFSCSDASEGTAPGADVDADASTSPDAQTAPDPSTTEDAGDTHAGPPDCAEPNVFCAASCSPEDIQAAADQAMASGLADTTISIGACDPNPYPWPSDSTLTLATDPNKAIRVVGSGVDTTGIVGFQIDVPNSGVLNLVELGHMSFDGNDEVPSILDYRLRPETLNTELYWHDLVIKNYTANYTLALEGWHGVISNLEMWCEDDAASQNPYGIGVHGDGVYSDHSVDFGTRNALFIEDSVFDSCSHTISAFCDAYIVFRHNTLTRADSHTDLHGPGYNYCYYNPDENTAGGGYELYDNEFQQSQGNWVINARAGHGHVITGNRFDSADYQVVLYWDGKSTTFGNGCGTDAGETCARCYTLDCDGCCQAQEKTYIWDNDGTVVEYLGGGADDCLIEEETYFLRPPDSAEDGISWTPFTYPHPLRSGQ